MENARFECTSAFGEVCVQNALKLLGESAGLATNTLKQMERLLNEREHLNRVIPTRMLRALYKVISLSHDRHLLGATKREGLSHHMLTGTYPNQQFVSGLVESVLVRFGPIPNGLPSMDDVRTLLDSVAERLDSASKRCIIETLIGKVASQSGAGDITQKYCKRSLMMISQSSLFSGITSLMQLTTIELYQTFHRMFRHIPVMRMVQEILEKVGYKFATTPLLDRHSFQDPRMVDVYAAFMKACTSLEATAKQYHIMFGGRRGDMHGW
jgi:hypothetical protein